MYDNSKPISLTERVAAIINSPSSTPTDDDRDTFPIGTEIELPQEKAENLEKKHQDINKVMLQVSKQDPSTIPTIKGNTGTVEQLKEQGLELIGSFNA